jgi:hypothetical protein
MPDWKAIAAARGIPLDDAGAKSLEALDESFAPLRDRLDWPDEPAIVFRPEETGEGQ